MTIRVAGAGVVTVVGPGDSFFFFSNLVTGPRRSLNFKLSDTRVYEPQIRACIDVAGAGVVASVGPGGCLRFVTQQPHAVWHL